ncbi:unnamed protein product [Caenorhabditis nigoni]
MKLFLVLLMLAAGFQLSSSTLFRASGSLHCYEGRRWCFHAFLVEKTLLTYDQIDHQGIHCTDSAMHPYHLEGKQETGILQKTFKIQLHIKHNCSRYGTVRVIQSRLKVVPVEQEFFEFNPSYDFTQTEGVGEVVKDLY